MLLKHSAGIVYTFAIFGIYFVHCHARHGMDHGQWAKEKSIMCYECNSEYDPRCGDPFDPYTIGVVNCSKKRPLDHIAEFKPTLCRKTIQKVQGNVRVIRGCGYIPGKSDDKECLMRSGTHDVNVRYCSCKHNLCNRGDLQTTASSSIVLLVVIMAITRLLFVG